MKDSRCIEKMASAYKLDRIVKELGEVDDLCPNARIRRAQMELSEAMKELLEGNTIVRLGFDENHVWGIHKIKGE